MTSPQCWTASQLVQVVQSFRGLHGGGPVFGAGIIATMFGFLGAIQRYVAGESAPVAKG
jgi:hypothetical protein